MPQQTFEITAPNGKTLEITGDRVPTEAELKDIFAKAGVDVAAPAAPAQPSALERGATQFYDKSPLAAGVAAVQGTANAVAHPLDTYFGLKPLAGTVVDLAKAQWDQAVQAAQKAKAAANGGGVLSASEALGHGLAAVLPILGPAAADVGEHFAHGDVAGGVGGSVGMLLPFAAKYGLEAKKAGTVAPTNAALDAADQARARGLRRDAESQVSEKVLAPGNPRYKGTAQQVAPGVLERGLKGDRGELAQMAEDGMADAGAKIDQVTNQYGAQQPMATKPLIDAMNDRIKSLQVNGKTIPTATERVTALTSLRDYLQKLGPAVPFDELKKIRDEWYQTADQARGYEKRGNNAMSDIGWAAREGGSAIREYFGMERPELLSANADYTFFKRLNDLLDPALGRPKTVNAVTSGATGGLHTTGAVIGEALTNVPGLKGVSALVMSKLLPAIREATNSPGWQLAQASKKFALADALERGDAGRAQTLLTEIAKLAPRTTSAPAMAASTAAGPATAREQR
jgi:hypothetical protein